MGSSESGGNWRAASTGASPSFVASAQEVRDLLHDDPSPEAEVMRREATQLIEFFRSWPTVKPDHGKRVQAITQLMDLTTRAMAFVRSKQEPSGR
jgi:hypothetical protein